MDKRQYKSTDLPNFDDHFKSDENRDISKLMNVQIYTNYRHLTDIRFKLLGFLPAVSVIACVELFG